jgi:oligoribonuclease (3'-5' exoribonuclease)
MPEVYNHMSHQIIDVSTIMSMARRWMIPVDLSGSGSVDREGDGNGGHRALPDVLKSIDMLRCCRSQVFVAPNAIMK